MRISTTVYLGPYVQILSPLSEVEETLDFCMCPDSCPNSKTDFCPKCGIDIVLRFRSEVTESEVPGVRELFLDEAFIDVFDYDEETVGGDIAYTFKPNIPMPGNDRAWEMKIGDLVDILALIEHGTAEKERDWFRNHYRPWLDRFESIWGDVKVSWGVIVSYR